MKRLTARQHKIRLFAVEYVRDFNGTRAAEAAGYSAKRARQTGSELLDDPECQAEIAKVMKQREERSRVKAFKVLDNMAPLIESNVEHYRIDDNGYVSLADGAPEDALLAVSSIKRKRREILRDNGSLAVEVDTEIKLWSKPETLRLAAQHLGMLKDRLEVTGKDGAAIAQELTVRFVRPEPKP